MSDYDASNDTDRYAPNVYQLGDVAPDVTSVLVKALRRTCLDLRVCMPCRIERVLGPQFVDVKPLLLQHVYTDAVEYPVVSGVLVCMPVSAGYSLTLPLQKGDTGVLLCADRSLEAYIASGGTAPVDPASDRNHELSDGIFIPGLVPFSQQTAPTTDLKLTNGKAVLSLQKTGQVTFSNGQDELMQLLVKTSSQLASLASVLASAQVLTALGPAPFLASTISLLQNVATTMQDVTSRLTTLKGS